MTDIEKTQLRMQLTYVGIAVLLVILLALAMILPFLPSWSPEGNLKRVVSENYESHGFSDFEEYKTIRFCDEVETLTKNITTKLSWDNSFYDAFLENIKGGFETTLSEDEILFNCNFYKNEIKKDEKLLEYLSVVDVLYPDKYDKVTFTIYRISYLVKNNDGEMIHDRCYGKFNTRGEMVAYKLTDTSDWVTIGETVSIPNFYEMF